MQTVIKSSRVRLEERPRRSPTAAPAGPHGKSVRAIRVDGEIRAIELRCDCGEVTVVELEYAETGDVAREVAA
jgi:hypothetical protein